MELMVIDMSEAEERTVEQVRVERENPIQGHTVVLRKFAHLCRGQRSFADSTP